MRIVKIAAKMKDKERVCAYVRVSTDKDAQLHSFAEQSHYWEQRLSNNPKYEYLGIFADEEISGKSMKNRAELSQMLQLARKGEIDRIFVKSVARFARNYTETIAVIREERELKSMHTKGYLAETMYEKAKTDILRKIKEQENQFAVARQQEIDLSGYEKAAMFNENVAALLIQATVQDWTVTFEFVNGYQTTKKYTNGRAGNVNGKLKRKA